MSDFPSQQSNYHTKGQILSRAFSSTLFEAGLPGQLRDRYIQPGAIWLSEMDAALQEEGFLGYSLLPMGQRLSPLLSIHLTNHRVIEK